MRRLLYNELKKWKKSDNRKPLLLQGARQVGKTYLIKEFAKKEYKEYVYLNFEEDKNLKLLFAETLNPEQIIKNIELKIGKKIDYRHTLIIFDEIQIVPDAINSLKYFYEKLPECHIISAGSLLGVSVGKKSSFPVGKVNFLTLYPMNFKEYLYAIEKDLLVERLSEINMNEQFPQIVHRTLLDHLKEYLFLGGMPEVLKSYLENKDYIIARKIQDDILEAYKRDFSKYSNNTQTIKISELWNSIPKQLAKENKKFKFSNIKKGARASYYETTIEWLKGAGLINIVYNIKKAMLPLKGYIDESKFKVFLLDIGLLGAMINIPYSILINPEDDFKRYFGAIVENYIIIELKTNIKKDFYYWKSGNQAEVDFIVQYDKYILPIEVKSGKNRNIKSLRSFEEKFNPKFLVRFSPRNFYINDNFINIPLYAASYLENIIKGVL